MTEMIRKHPMGGCVRVEGSVCVWGGWLGGWWWRDLRTKEIKTDHQLHSLNSIIQSTPFDCSPSPGCFILSPESFSMCIVHKMHGLLFSVLLHKASQGRDVVRMEKERKRIQYFRGIGPIFLALEMED